MKQSHKLQIGDLVRYTRDPDTLPPNVIPDENQIGVIIECNTFLVGSDPSSSAILELVSLWWNDPKWNTRKGFSEEYPFDLTLVQSLDHLSKG